jgi:hypothetical protein
MENFSMLFNFLLRLNYSQIILLLLAMLIMFLGPIIVKKKYLHRLGLEKDERIENRNEWILFPKQYNFTEKSLIILIYASSLLFIIISVNIDG